MTLNGVMADISTYFNDFRASRPITSIWLKTDSDDVQQKCSSKNLVFGNIWYDL